MTLAQRDVLSQFYCMLIGRHTHGVDQDIMETMSRLRKFQNFTLLMFVLQYSLFCFVIAIANFDSETFSTTPKRLRKCRAGKKLHNLRQ